MLKCVLSIFIGVVIVCGVPSSGLALTNEEVFSQFQFNFITPGARASALGGAFIGLADDATAVEANPAGLTILTVPEVSVEFKHFAYKTKQIYQNLPLTANLYPGTDIYRTEIVRKEFGNSVESASFLSVVYPYKRLVFSLYRQELVHYKSSFRTSSVPIAIPETDQSFFPTDASIELSVVNYGIGFAVQLFKGFSLAISPRWSEMEMRSHTTRFDPDPTSPYPIPTDFSDDELVNSSGIDDGDSQLCFNAGLLWQVHPKVSIGAVYKNGAAFTVTETYFGLLPIEYDPDVTEFTLNVPDSLGVGIAFRTTDFLTLTLDVIHIRYEDLLEDFDILAYHNIHTPENFSIDNATEVHFGLEYIVPYGEQFLALRAGIYNEPDHTIRFTGTTGNSLADIVGREVFPGGAEDNQIHLTGGLGVVIRDLFQIDLAANFADKQTQLGISVVYRF